MLRPTPLTQTPHSNRLRLVLKQRPELGDLELAIFETLHGTWPVRLDGIDGRIGGANFPGESDNAFGISILGERKSDPHPSAVQSIWLLHQTLRPELLP